MTAGLCRFSVPLLLRPQWLRPRNGEGGFGAMPPMESEGEQ